MRKIRGCIFEAMRQKDLAFFGQKGLVVSLQRDERAKKLQIEFCASSPKLETRRGTLGVRSMREGGAAAIVTATEEMITAFFAADSKSSRPHSTLKKSFLRSVELLSCDAAPDEVRAAKEAWSPSLQGLRALTPSARFISRDKAHGTQRTVKPHIS